MIVQLVTKMVDVRVVMLPTLESSTILLLDVSPSQDTSTQELKLLRSVQLAASTALHSLPARCVALLSLSLEDFVMAHVHQEHMQLVLQLLALLVALVADVLSTVTRVTQVETVSVATLQLTSDS